MASWSTFLQSILELHVPIWLITLHLFDFLPDLTRGLWGPSNIPDSAQPVLNTARCSLHDLSRAPSAIRRMCGARPLFTA